GEHRVLTLAATGALRAKSVHEAEREFGFFDIKADVEQILDVFNVEFDSSLSGPEYYHPGRSISNNDLVRAGELHPDFAEEYKFRHRVYIAESDVDALFQSKNRQAVQPIPKFPSVRRDFSLILDK